MYKQKMYVIFIKKKKRTTLEKIKNKIFPEHSGNQKFNETIERFSNYQMRVASDLKLMGCRKAKRINIEVYCTVLLGFS